MMQKCHLARFVQKKRSILLRISCNIHCSSILGILQCIVKYSAEDCTIHSIVQFTMLYSSVQYRVQYSVQLRIEAHRSDYDSMPAPWPLPPLSSIMHFPPNIPVTAGIQVHNYRSIFPIFQIIPALWDLQHTVNVNLFQFTQIRVSLGCYSFKPSASLSLPLISINFSY